MKLILFILDPLFRTGLRGIGLILLAGVDAVLFFYYSARRQRWRFLRVLVRLVFLGASAWFVLEPVLTMLGVAQRETPVSEWSSLGYLTGMIGRADDILRIWIDLVLLACCVWLLVTGAMHLGRAMLLWRKPLPEVDVYTVLDSFAIFVSSVLLGLTLWAMRIGLRFLHPNA